VLVDTLDETACNGFSAGFGCGACKDHSASQSILDPIGFGMGLVTLCPTVPDDLPYCIQDVACILPPSTGSDTNVWVSGLQSQVECNKVSNAVGCGDCKSQQESAAILAPLGYPGTSEGAGFVTLCPANTLRSEHQIYCQLPADPLRCTDPSFPFPSQCADNICYSTETYAACGNNPGPSSWCCSHGDCPGNTAQRCRDEPPSPPSPPGAPPFPPDSGWECFANSVVIPPIDLPKGKCATYHGCSCYVYNEIATGNHNKKRYAESCPRCPCTDGTPENELTCSGEGVFKCRDGTPVGCVGQTFKWVTDSYSCAKPGDEYYGCGN